MAGHFGTRIRYIKNHKQDRILSTDKNRFLSYVSLPDDKGCMFWRGVVGNCGYGQFMLLDKKKIIRAHRMSFKYFKGNLDDSMYVCHHCDKKLCVAPEHLFLGEAKDNTSDMIQKHRDIKAKGNAHYLSKLKESDIIEIRNFRESGMTYLEISKIFNVHMQTIAAVISGRSWSHVKSKGEVNVCI